MTRIRMGTKRSLVSSECHRVSEVFLYGRVCLRKELISVFGGEVVGGSRRERENMNIRWKETDDILHQAKRYYI